VSLRLLYLILVRLCGWLVPELGDLDRLVAATAVAGVNVEVTDDGPSGQAPRPVPPTGSGHGLIGMRERAAVFGGQLSAAPHATGFRVTASLPTTDSRTSDMHTRDGAQ
jgi:signal transduction histidine kinase